MIGATGGLRFCWILGGDGLTGGLLFACVLDEVGSDLELEEPPEEPPEEPLEEPLEELPEKLRESEEPEDFSELEDFLDPIEPEEP
jgi:hypothetical protein